MKFSAELLRVLRKELEIVEVLKETTFNKTDLIINNQINDLAAITKKEESLINSMALAEEERLKLMDSWSVDIDSPLSSLVEKIPESKESLGLIGEKLSKILEEIKDRNSVNNELIKESLEWLDFNMNLLTDVSIPATYSKDEKGKERKKSVFDRKV